MERAVNDTMTRMHCFRLSHAGIVVEHDGRSLVIDPGDYSDERELSAALAAADPIVAIVITHEHVDHWTPENVALLRAAAPEAPIYTTAATAEGLAEAGIVVDVVVAGEGDRVQAGPFVLEFTGRRHAVPHMNTAVFDNIGVRVNGVLSWGGDSLSRSPLPVDTLGVPVLAAPWGSVSQLTDFVLESAPRRAFVTHDGLLSDRGVQNVRNRVQWCLDQLGGEFVVLPHIADDPRARFDLGDALVTSV